MLSTKHYYVGMKWLITLISKIIRKYGRFTFNMSYPHQLGRLCTSHNSITYCGKTRDYSFVNFRNKKKQ